METAADPKNDDPTSQTIRSIDEVLDRIGYGAFQRRQLLAAGLCSASDAMEILVLRFLSSAVQDEWNLTSTQSSTLISSVFVGAFVGTLFLGRLGDLYGRRGTFVITAAIVAIFGLLSAACTSYGYLLLTRTLVGVGIGGITVPFDTYAECLPKEYRGKGLVTPSYFWTMGTMLVVIGARITTDHWRFLCLRCAIPCLLATMIAYMVVPESPQWLIAQSTPSTTNGGELSSQQEQALTILRRAAELNGKDPDEILPLGTRLVVSSVEAVGCDSEDPPTSSIHELLAPHRRGFSLAILIIWFGYAFLYYGTVLVTTQVFTKNEDTEQFQPGIHFDYSAILWTSLAEIVATTCLAITIDAWGRRFWHAISFGMGGLFVMALCFWIPSSTTRAWDIVLAFQSRFWIFSGSAVTWIWTAELLETHYRTTGHSIANAGGRLGGFLAPYVISPTTMRTMGWILCLTSWVVVAIAWTCLPEMSRRPLDDRGGIVVMESRRLELTLTPPLQHQQKNDYRPLSSSSSSSIFDQNDIDTYHTTTGTL